MEAETAVKNQLLKTRWWRPGLESNRSQNKGTASGSAHRNKWAEASVKLDDKTGHWDRAKDEKPWGVRALSLRTWIDGGDWIGARLGKKETTLYLEYARFEFLVTPPGGNVWYEMASVSLQRLGLELGVGGHRNLDGISSPRSRWDDSPSVFVKGKRRRDRSLGY